MAIGFARGFGSLVPGFIFPDKRTTGHPFIILAAGNSLSSLSRAIGRSHFVGLWPGVAYFMFGSAAYRRGAQPTGGLAFLGRDIDPGGFWFICGILWQPGNPDDELGGTRFV